MADMILGLSHIAIGTQDVERSSIRLAEYGYQMRFDEPSLENHAAKAALLARHQPLHHIRSLAAPGVMAIELLDHGPMSSRQAAALIPIFRCAAPLAGWQEHGEQALPLREEAWPLLEKALGQRPRVVFDPKLQLTLLWIASGEPAGLWACAMPHEDQAAVEALLTALRFRASPTTGLWSLLTPIPALQARIVLAPYREHPEWQAHALLDAPGCPCIALMARGGNTSRPDAVRGETVTFDLTVNAKPCKITMLRPEHGPIAELVEQ